MKYCIALTLFSIFPLSNVFSQSADSGKIAETIPRPLRFSLNSDGSLYFQFALLNQSWVRYNQSNDQTTLFSAPAPNTFDIGLRRTRIQAFGQIASRAFVYFQFGQNNFNYTAGYPSGNRKIATFFHDALCELRLSAKDQLKVGAGLTIMNGLSRFSQPSIGTIMTLDVPVFLQYSVDQIDQFDRRLAVYARGIISKLDYRVYVSNPFPVGSNAQAQPPLSRNSAFINHSLLPNGYSIAARNQYGAYFTWNIFENEPHVTPYLAGTYLGKRKVWSIAAGAVYQGSATWRLVPGNGGLYSDTAYSDMLHLGVETFADLPVNKTKGTAFSAFAGYYNTNYGPAYLRYNGLMNPATGLVSGSYAMPGAHGNAYPMFGTGDVFYVQAGYVFGIRNSKEKLMPYASAQLSRYEALQNKLMFVNDIGINWLISSHNAKLSLDLQTRPQFFQDLNGNTQYGKRKICLIVQYQITI